MGRRREHQGVVVARLLETLCQEEMTVAEIGVYRGQTSAILLREFPRLTLHMVDPWVEFAPDTEYAKTNDKLAFRNKDACERDFEEALRATDFAKDRRVIHRCFSHEAASLVPDGLDGVFIDAEHSEKALKNDIEIWYPKIRMFGIHCGHDYSPKFWPGVTKAVNDWFRILGIPVRHAGSSVWWHVKNDPNVVAKFGE